MKAREGRIRAELDYSGALSADDPQPSHERDELGLPLCGADDSRAHDMTDDGPTCPGCADVRADIEEVPA